MNRGPVVREGYVYIAAALFLAVVMYFGFGVAVAVPFVVLACYFTYFFSGLFLSHPSKRLTPDRLSFRGFSHCLARGKK